MKNVELSQTELVSLVSAIASKIRIYREELKNPELGQIMREVKETCLNQQIELLSKLGEFVD
jgi:hypothetical protein